ncbi:sigma-70 family RNA polymerase sigma factor [Knoellia sp. S7-12]|uniref:sigma-70 family RNA polymerase sigma factor n=1 Tax=Knoellia sp. S7-12 TaxID=3126698 RepID=UPI003369BC78
MAGTTTRPSPPAPEDSRTGGCSWRHNPEHDRAEFLLATAQTCGDEATRQRLRDDAVVLTLDLADGVARRYRGRGVEGDDLIQVGRLALVKAAQGYRHDRGSGFPAYAIPTISGEIKRYFRDHGWVVRPPRRIQELRAEIAREEGHLRQILLREPTDHELADALDVELADVREARRCSLSYNALSLDVPGASEAAGAYLLTVAHVDELVADRDALGRAVAGLTPREQLIVRLRFVDGLTQLEIGESIGLSQMQVSRLLNVILARLRDALEDLPMTA